MKEIIIHSTDIYSHKGKTDIVLERHMSKTPEEKRDTLNGLVYNK
jgi:hypothetical protein